MYDDVATSEHDSGWINFLVQVARHRYGITPDKIIGINSNTAILHNDEEVVGKLALGYPLGSSMPVDTLPLPTLMIQTGIDQPVCLVYNEIQLSSMMN